MTLTEFLTARLDEDEAVARRTVVFGYDSDGPNGVLAAAGRLGREVEAKRRIVEDLEEYAADYRAAPSDFAAGRRHAALLAATRVATIYSDHPDHREEWRP